MTGATHGLYWINQCSVFISFQVFNAVTQDCKLLLYSFCKISYCSQESIDCNALVVIVREKYSCYIQKPCYTGQFTVAIVVGRVQWDARGDK